MPQQTVYIRNADMERWKALENKAAFISKHLNNEPEPDYIEKPEKRGSSSIKEQLEELGLKHDHTLPGQAWSETDQTYVPYKIVDGEVIL